MDRTTTLRSQFNNAGSPVGWIGGPAHVPNTGEFPHFPAYERRFKIGQPGQKRKPNRT